MNEDIYTYDNTAALKVYCQKLNKLQRLKSLYIIFVLAVLYAHHGHSLNLHPGSLGQSGRLHRECRLCYKLSGMSSLLQTVQNVVFLTICPECRLCYKLSGDSPDKQLGLEPRPR